MANPLIVNDVIQVSVVGEVAGRPCVNVFHIDANRPIAGDAATKAEALLAAYQEHLVPMFSAQYVLQGANYIDLDSLTGDSGSLGPVAGQPQAGARTGGESPQVSVLVRKNVSASPRGVSFRMFLPPPGEADVTSLGTLSTGYRSALQADLDAFRTAVDEADGVGTSESHLCCVSYPRDDDGEITGPGNKYDLDSYEVMATAATQRRRLRG